MMAVLRRVVLHERSTAMPLRSRPTVLELRRSTRTSPGAKHQDAKQSSKCYESNQAAQPAAEWRIRSFLLARQTTASIVYPMVRNRRIERANLSFARQMWSQSPGSC
jgi:hypothetical protein